MIWPMNPGRFIFHPLVQKCLTRPSRVLGLYIHQFQFVCHFLSIYRTRVTLCRIWSVLCTVLWQRASTLTKPRTMTVNAYWCHSHVKADWFLKFFIDGDGKNIFTELELEHCEINGYILSAVGCVDVFQ